MPLYDYSCDICGEIREVLQLGEAKSPECCDVPMRRTVSVPAVIRILNKDGKPTVYSKGYKEGYSKEYLKSIDKDYDEARRRVDKKLKIATS